MNLPEDFCRQMEALLGKAGYEQFTEALEWDVPVSIRLNRKKLSARGLLASGEDSVTLLASDICQDRVLWSADGYYLSERPAFTFDPLFHAGCYYVQEASSMFLEQIIRRYVTEPTVALDLCAAPGGKSTHLRSLLPEGSLLVANEVIRQRSQILAENLMKWGDKDVIVTNNDPADFASFAGMFDLIVADAPCSGEGMFRKDEGALGEWSLDNVRLCTERQRRILADIWECLRPGGILVYSTCTFNCSEDEDNLFWLQETREAEPLEIDCPQEWRVTGDLTARNLPVYRFLPQHVCGEGFFICAVRKSGNAPLTVPSSSKKQKRVPKSVEPPARTAGWLDEPSLYSVKNEDNRWIAIPKAWEAFYDYAKTQLRVLYAGIPLGEQKGKDMIPAHALAVSNELNHAAFPRQEVDYATAVAYLRKEVIGLPPEISRGIVLLTYKDIPLGFVKNIGNRANNLYPNEWRIRNSRLPVKETSVLKV